MARSFLHLSITKNIWLPSPSGESNGSRASCGSSSITDLELKHNINFGEPKSVNHDARQLASYHLEPSLEEAYILRAVDGYLLPLLSLSFYIRRISRRAVRFHTSDRLINDECYTWDPC
ncbi:hypothetical protein CC2G_008457 [Coprinopsis cinerea AmutBmut pab1-1]|nr:hypothetical protein CC2G_008457 [Coprinopsis cinerea AmutBmut pab1-1]